MNNAEGEKRGWVIRNFHCGKHGYVVPIPSCLTCDKEEWDAAEKKHEQELATQRQAVLREVTEYAKEAKSDCKTYHNEYINTPDKIRGYNFALECVISKLTRLSHLKGE
jgi:hypothetical protein